MKKKRVQNRRIFLEMLVEAEQAPFCKKHQREISYEDISKKRCYTGRRGKKYCKYLQLEF